LKGLQVGGKESRSHHPGRETSRFKQKGGMRTTIEKLQGKRFETPLLPLFKIIWDAFGKKQTGLLFKQEKFLVHADSFSFLAVVVPSWQQKILWFLER
jgi:hypothetical protein